LEDLKKALVEVAKPSNICSSWQKATLTRCTSETLFVEANKVLANMNQHIVDGTALPRKVDTVMDDEEEFVLCLEDDQGLAARHRLRIAQPITPCPRPIHGLGHGVAAEPALPPRRPFRDALPCQDSAWIMQPLVLLPQAPGPGSSTWARHLP
jgi:hypothetical protein